MEGFHIGHMTDALICCIQFAGAVAEDGPKNSPLLLRKSLDLLKEDLTRNVMHGDEVFRPAMLDKLAFVTIKHALLQTYLLFTIIRKYSRNRKMLSTVAKLEVDLKDCLEEEYVSFTMALERHLLHIGPSEFLDVVRKFQAAQIEKQEGVEPKKRKERKKRESIKISKSRCKKKEKRSKKQKPATSQRTLDRRFVDDADAEEAFIGRKTGFKMPRFIRPGTY